MQEKSLNLPSIAIEDLIEEEIQVVLAAVRQAVLASGSCCLDNESDISKFMENIEKKLRDLLEIK